MIRPFSDQVELRDLLDALCEEQCTAEQMRRLEELVLTHPEAEAFYIQYMSLHAEIVRHFGDLPAPIEQSLCGRVELLPAAGRDSSPAHRVSAPPHRPRFRGLAAIGVGLSAVAAALILVLTLSRGPAVLPPPDGPSEASDDTVAVLLQAPEAQWEDTRLSTRPGTPLRPGWLRLKSGFAHIEFYSGATVILEGPAEFQLISRTEAYCARGKLRGSVPPQAHGFTIRAPNLNLVDRGTEFGLDVGAGNQTEVHVFQGKVELHEADPSRQGAAPRELETGQGIRQQGPGPYLPIAVSPATFKTAQDLARQFQAEALRRQQDWLAASDALRRDPSVVVYYPFQADQVWSRTLLDCARSRQHPQDGAIVGCSWSSGRWPGKQGLEFKQVSDRVRLNVPGEFDALTLMAWVRVDALPNRFNSLFMTDSWDEAAPHWHISNVGQIELGVQGRKRKGGVRYTTPEIFTPQRLGHWVHLAVVYDLEAGQVIHYVDGRPVHQDAIKLDIRLRLGDAEIGNWNVAGRRHTHPIRYFSGCIDEFLLFSRALGEAEIERLWAQGRPPA